MRRAWRRAATARIRDTRQNACAALLLVYSATMREMRVREDTRRVRERSVIMKDEEMRGVTSRYELSDARY